MTFNKHRFRGIAAGYRSGLEETISDVLRDQGIEVLYETDKIYYTIPTRSSKYTPDFKLPKANGFWYLETKGIWAVADRAKHILIQKQHPNIDIRFLFSNARAKLYKGSKTTYADYCEKNGFRYAHKHMPQDWLDECLSHSTK
tara:strand:+ start:4532 stop:4960 length:429 start_codon:yes stop_codon:yes gene_type:complete